MEEEENKNSPWFGPKSMGFGIRPITWQGWLITLIGVLTEISVITLTHDRQPSWFRAKTSGSGFTPASWQGWLATLGPVAVFLLIITATYYKQRKN
jgi:hypothetical protein